ncbi:MAG: DUF188 domain-containing protein [Treponema sp.]|nr:DUF188 domain-containing protein [Treponema sp.]
MKDFPFCIWIDADSCPVQVRDLTVRFALRLNIPVKFVANHNIPFRKNNLFEMIICDNEKDAADDYIVDNSKINDIVITRDIPLASRLVDKKICVLNDRGYVFTETNIAEKLASRNLNYMLIENGYFPEIKRSGTFGKKELNLFANSLDRELQKKLKN